MNPTFSCIVASDLFHAPSKYSERKGELGVLFFLRTATNGMWRKLYKQGAASYKFFDEIDIALTALIASLTAFERGLDQEGGPAEGISELTHGVLSWDTFLQHVRQ